MFSFDYFFKDRPSFTKNRGRICEQNGTNFAKGLTVEVDHFCVIQTALKSFWDRLNVFNILKSYHSLYKWIILHVWRIVYQVLA